jgi:molecular chaperone GrpE (heat shock protein)
MPEGLPVTAVDQVTVVELSAPDRQAPDDRATLSEAAGGNPTVDQTTLPAEPLDLPDHAVEKLAARLAAADARIAELADLVVRTADQQAGRLESTSSVLDGLSASQATTAAGLELAGSRLDRTDIAAREANQRIDELAARLTSVDDRLHGLHSQLADTRGGLAEHDSALLDVRRSIAAEVEKQTTDTLVDSQHSLQLAVNSIAQLALAMAESATDITEDLSADSASALLDSFRVDLDAVLAQLGFVSLETAVGTGFDPRRHRALKRVATQDQASDRQISRVIRDGYRSATTGRILLFADVEVGRFQP